MYILFRISIVLDSDIYVWIWFPYSHRHPPAQSPTISVAFAIIYLQQTSRSSHTFWKKKSISQVHLRFCFWNLPQCHCHCQCQLSPFQTKNICIFWCKSWRIAPVLAKLWCPVCSAGWMFRPGRVQRKQSQTAVFLYLAEVYARGLGAFVDICTMLFGHFGACPQ